MKATTKSAALSFAAALLLGALAAPGASAATQHETTVTITSIEDSGSSADFLGKVSSPKPACRFDRKVEIFWKKIGADENLGYDRTGSEPIWFFSSSDFVPSGGMDFYAVAPRKVLNKNNVCKEDRSPVFGFVL